MEKANQSWHQLAQTMRPSDALQVRREDSFEVAGAASNPADPLDTSGTTLP